MDTMEEVFLAFPPEGTILQWNRSLEEVTGLAGEEIEGLRPTDLISAREESSAREQIENIQKDGQERFEARLQTRDGQAIPYEFTGSLFRQNGRALICLSGRDLSGRTQAEEKQKAYRQGLTQQAQEARKQRQETQKKHDLLELIQDVSSAANEAQTLEEALQSAVDKVCQLAGWTIGHVYVPSRRGAPSGEEPIESGPDRLMPTGIWNEGSQGRFEAFRESTERAIFAEGVGLIGRILATGEPAWIQDVTENRNFIRREVAAGAGIKGAFAFPVPVEGEVGAVLEFFSEEERSPDDQHLKAMATVGTQLGQVAERERAIESLTSSLEQYRSLKESTVDGIVLAGEEGLITDWNRGAEEIFGYKKREILGRPIETLMPERHKEPHRKGMEQVKRTGEGPLLGETVELEGLRKSGEEFPLELSLSSWKVEGERSFSAIIRDITERRRREHELRQSEERYRRLFEDALDGIVITTPNGSLVDANPAAAEILGYNWGELKGMNTARLYANPGERKRIAALLRKEEGISGREVRLRRADGTEIVCEISVTTRRGEKEEPGAYRTFFRDVTEQRKAEKALKESEEMFRNLSENAIVGIGLIQNGAYAYVNPALSEITGYSQEELLGESPELFVHPNDWLRVRKHVQRRLQGEAEDVRYETRIQTKSGETRHVEVSGTRIDYRGEPAAIATIQDVTEERRLQREMIQVQEEERKRLGQDLHDSLASQLTGANLKLGLLSTKAEEEVQEDIQEVQALIEESAGDVRRLSRGLNPAGLPEGDLLSALEGLVSNTEGARLEGVDESDGLRSLEESPLGEEEATHLYRIAQEAVNNARKYAEASEIVIRLQEEDGALALEVEDDGKGFDSDQVSGKGLGLRSMRHRAELLGAELDIESSPGEGSLVQCRLPV